MFDQFHCWFPEVNSMSHLGDFRPISLARSLYKLMVKVLALRLRSIIDKLISPNKSTFLKRWMLVDIVVVVNWEIDLDKRYNKACLIFKLDFEKVYDWVNWNFLDYMLTKYGLCEKCRSWIRACMFSSNCTVLVNGYPTQEISIQRGLNHGYPLTPFMFLLVVEWLNCLVTRAKEIGIYSGFGVGKLGLALRLVFVNTLDSVPYP